MLITDNKSTFYSTLLGSGELGGLVKEYSLYAFTNVDNFERPLTSPLVMVIDYYAISMLLLLCDTCYACK